MTTPLLRNRRHPGIAIASRLGRDLQMAPTWLNDNVNLATSTIPVVTVTAPSTTHTMGAWVEIASALTEDVCCVTINTTAPVNVSGTNTSTMLELGVGASGSEQAIVTGILVGNKSSSTAGWVVSVFIPKGARVAVRMQSAVPSASYTFRFRFGRLNYRAAKPAPYVSAIGADYATSSGVFVPVGSIHTKGAWTELTPATSERLAGFQVCADGASDTAIPGGSALLDIGFGPSGSEVPLLENLFYVIGASEQMDFFGGALPWCLVDIPPGTRLAARMQASSVSMDNIGVVLLGFPQRGR